jgi:hypothetical protein
MTNLDRLLNGPFPLTRTGRLVDLYQSLGGDSLDSQTTKVAAR